MIETKEIYLPENHYHYNHNLPEAEYLITEHTIGASWKEIASKYGVSENTIWSRIKAYNDILSGKRKKVEIRSGKDNGMFREDLDVQKMVEDYQSGLSTNAIAEKYTCGKTTVKRKLKNAGVVFRIQEPAPPKSIKEPKLKTEKVVYPTGVIVENKYSKIYWNVIEKARNREITPEKYYEIHHAYPEALGGGNEDSNLVHLTAKEHYVCHHLLTKCTRGDDKRKMLYAWLLMAHCDKDGHRYIPSIQYSHLREELAAAGKSEEQKIKMSEAAKRRTRRPFSDEAKRNMSEARRKNWAEGKYTNDHMKGPKSEEHKEKISKAMISNHNSRNPRINNLP